ncbi:MULTISPECIES: hypothetical protein [unclassified Janthinobacterium]|uniref:hypothetical protein n=1 Tax=unclassified Janthinobacterium TaxID=2610881 RepID=UPI0012F959FD|nr:MULTISPECIES: hypothetical protein [unclassified Janthinobacterium]
MNFSYQIIDLDLNDGVTPEIQFYRSSMNGRSEIQSTGRLDFSSLDPHTGVEISSVADTMGGASKAATWDYISSSATSLVPTESYYQQGCASYVDYGQRFLLSANTQILLTIPVHLSANSYPGVVAGTALAQADISGEIWDTYDRQGPIHSGAFRESLMTSNLNHDGMLRGSLYSHGDTIFGDFKMPVFPPGLTC